MIDKIFSTLGDLPRSTKFIILLVLDFLVLSFAYGLSAYLTTSLVPNVDFQLSFWHYSAVVALGLISCILLNFYRRATRYVTLRILTVVLLISALSALYFHGVASLGSFPAYGAAASVMYGAVVYIMLSGSRFLIGAYYNMRFDRLKTKVLIYGAGSAGRQLSETASHGQEYLPVAFIDADPELHGVVVQGLKVFAPEELGYVIKRCKVDKVLLALPSIGASHRKEILNHIKQYGVPVQTIPGLKDIVEGRMKIDEFQNVTIEDLLGRDPVPPNEDLLNQDIQGKVIMITGAGGSIGSELCRQIVLLNPRQVVLFESSEYALYAIGMELEQVARDQGLKFPINQVLGTVQNKAKVDAVLKAFSVQTIYHAAAYKHVPLVEYNINEGIKNNIIGTMNVATAAVETGVEQFVLISTDKAVRPTNVMGASKRFSELLLQALASSQSDTRFTMVRFGNVLGSSGSVIPFFEKQIREGGPVTVTHKDITRFFMTIPEAAQLVIQAGAMGKGGDVFVLDMGEPVKIVDLATNLINIMGLQVKSDENPNGDIEIIYSGLRPGEKLYEELLIGDNVGLTEHPRIMTAKEKCLPWDELQELIAELMAACEAGEQDKIREILLKAPADYQPSSEIVDYLWTYSKADGLDGAPKYYNA